MTRCSSGCQCCLTPLVSPLLEQGPLNWESRACQDQQLHFIHSTVRARMTKTPKIFISASSLCIFIVHTTLFPIPFLPKILLFHLVDRHGKSLRPTKLRLRFNIANISLLSLEATETLQEDYSPLNQIQFEFFDSTIYLSIDLPLPNISMPPSMLEFPSPNPNSCLIVLTLFAHLFVSLKTFSLTPLGQLRSHHP